MLSHTLPVRRALALLTFCFLAPAAIARAQQTATPTPEPADEVIRVNTELVQTDVIVLDKQGKFVDGLKPDRFELRVDGRPQPISFFERVAAGSFNEDAQLAAARGGNAGDGRAANATGAKPLDRGRTVIFFIDDLHLSAASLNRTRNLLLRFIDQQLGQNDQALISTATGQLGFLQQISDDKNMLRAAVARLALREAVVRDLERPSMTELQAMVIEQNDPNVVGYFVDATLRETPIMGNPEAARASAERRVHSRASQLTQITASVVTNTLNSLRALMRSTAQLPGRKIVYLISDGFALETKRSEITDGLRRVTDAAVRAGVAVYTLDARGLSAEMTGMPDASSDASPDPAGRLAMGMLNETTARQEPLRIIAADTGGRALLNTNALDEAVGKAFKENSLYYLLAWRPENPEARGGKFHRIEVNVKDRPDLSVLVQRGFYSAPPPDDAPRIEAKRNETKDKTNAAVAYDEQTKTLFAALRSPFPKTALQTSLALNYYDLPPDGMILTASVQVDFEASKATDGAASQPERAEIIGALYNDKGEVKKTFQRGLSFAQAASNASPNARRYLILSNNMAVTPGLYQVRVAARDPRTGRTGSAMQWLEVPDLAKGALAMSSIFIGERSDKEAAPASGEQSVGAPVVINVDRRFARSSRMRFMTYVYNAARPQSASPDVAVQVQVFRDEQPVVTSPLSKMDTEGVTDFVRLPYAAELPLGGLTPGSYVLKITAIDRVAKKSVTQRTRFIVE